MGTADLEVFTRHLQNVNVTYQRTPASDIVEAVEDAAIEPVVAPEMAELSVFSSSSSGIIVDPTPAEVWEAKSGVTSAAFAIADYGSVFLPHDPSGSELISLFVDRHIVLLDIDDILPNMKVAFNRLDQEINNRGSSGIIATGPSSTADMGALVRGAHGPKEVHIILTEDE